MKKDKDGKTLHCKGDVQGMGEDAHRIVPSGGGATIFILLSGIYCCFGTGRGNLDDGKRDVEARSGCSDIQYIGLWGLSLPKSEGSGILTVKYLVSSVFRQNSGGRYTETLRDRECAFLSK